MKYFLSNERCQPLHPDRLSEFMEQFTFHVNSVGSWKRDRKKRAHYTINDIEFIFYVSGSSKTTILGTEHHCCENDFMILEPLQLYTSENEDQLETEYYFIHFDVLPIHSMQDFLACFRSRVLRAEHPEYILSLFRTVQQEVSRREPGYISKVNACIKLLSVEIIRSTGAAGLPLSAAPEIPTVTELFVDQCVAYIGNHIKGDCSIQALSSHFAVSANYIYKAFTQVLGESPSRYITKLRIFRAKSLLLSDLFTIEQVAGEVGYTSLAHFSKVFKAQTGCSPRVYRNQNRG